MRENVNKRAAIYCRNALKDPARLKEQQELLTFLARARGYTHLEYYSDDGASGFSLDRPGLQQLEQDIAAGLVDVVIVKNIARISRNRSLAAVWMEKVSESGIGLLTAMENYTLLPTI